VKPEDEWRAVEEIDLLIGVGDDRLQVGFTGAVEAKNEARRIVVPILDEPGQPLETVARWREGIPNSVRVFAKRFTAGQCQVIEGQLIEYVRGLRPGKIDWAKAPVPRFDRNELPPAP
jgi:hypothetical protein